MKFEQYSAKYGYFSFNYTVVRRERKTLEIAVEPDSTVRVAAPKSASPERIAQKVKKRASWILQQQGDTLSNSHLERQCAAISLEKHIYTWVGSIG